ncbi:MAG: carboxylesterase family protein [Lachnospiraceae bacterium]|nr:carboxylesterase family protein [Lachnospiraceae bacterium]
MVKTEYGLVEGFKRGGCTIYQGIPYAKPPIGRLAFKHPVKCDSWSGVLKADHGSKNPIQPLEGFGVGNNGLDCLYLNIFVPDKKGDEKLPVMFWIFGGAYVQGAAGAVEEGSNILAYNLERFAVESNTVVVSVNYRLGIYGFLNLNSLNSNFDINNGLHDQLMALQFVNDNIEAFGGDSNNITVFGESAGAGSTLALMSMDKAKGLFHKAIVQSAPVDHVFTYRESAKYARLFLKIAGIHKASDLLNMSQKQLDYSFKMFSNILRAQTEIRCPFSPIIDGVDLVDEPKKLAVKSNISMLIGNTKNEGALFTRNMPTFVMPIVAPLLGLKLKPDADTFRQRVINALTRKVFIEPQMEILNDYKGKVYKYVYQYVVKGSKLGSFHGSEVFIMFGAKETFDGLKIEKDDEIGALMRRIWGKFATTGNPGWEEYSPGANTFVIG